MESKTAIKAVVCLGNPGARYAHTRHNVGFMVADRLAARTSASFQRKFKADLARLLLDSVEVWLLKPQTFMNVSGDSVQPMTAFYAIAPEEMLVVHDDIELPLGELRLKEGGGHAGHNGLRSIIDRLGSRQFNRLRFGVGRPGVGSVSDHVLGPFTADEEIILSRLVETATELVCEATCDGFEATMQRVGGKVVV